MESNRQLDIAEIMKRCMEIAKDAKHEYVTVEHTLLAILELEFDTIEQVIANCKFDKAGVMNYLSNSIGEYNGTLKPNTDPRETLGFSKVLHRSVAGARLRNQKLPDCIDLLLSIYDEENSPAAYILHTKSDYDEIQAYIIDNFDETPSAEYGDFYGNEEDGPVTGGRQDRALVKAKQVLGKFCDNLNELVEKEEIDPLIGRYGEIYEVTKTLARRKKNNVILVGDSGVGKTAIAEGLAYRIVNNEVADTLKDHVVYSLDIGSLISGSKYRGEFEERLKMVLDSLTILADHEHPILFIDEIHTINGAGAGGSSNSLDMANMMKPALASGLKCIGSTTADEYRKTFEKDAALSRRFEKVNVLEPSVAECIDIIKGLAPKFEKFHNVKYDEDALEAAVSLSAKYIHNKRLPDKAIDVIDKAAAALKIAVGNDEEADRTVSFDKIEEEVSIISKIPRSSMQEQEEENLQQIEVSLKSKVFGQDLAIETVTENYLMARAGLRDPNKPIGNYLFAGPTGVGKTELAKQLATTLGVKLVRFDMSEYMEKHSVSKFIGSPPGYVGYEEEGLLIKAIEDNPSCILLLDEIEKAHPDVFNILLQAMDNGEMSSSKGKAVSFRNVILIMTTNAGAAASQKESIGFGRGKLNTDAQAREIEKTFTPEFRNRLDAVVTFNALDEEIIEMVVDKFIKQLNEMAVEKGVFVELSKAAKSKLIEIGYDPKMGARPMDRAIQENIKKPLSKEMLFGKLKAGGKAMVDVANDEFTISFVNALDYNKPKELEFTE